MDQKSKQYPGVDTEIDGKLVIIKLNSPKRKNALTPAMYAGIINALKEASENPSVSIVAITGTGDFYSSGNDFGFVMRNVSDNSENPAETQAQNGMNMVQ